MKHLALCTVAMVAGIALSQPVLANQAPVVSNVQAEQREGTSLVDITYDVEDPDGDLMMITVQVSNDAGRTYTIFPRFLSGDVGEGLSSGAGKQILWDAGEDIPGMWSFLIKVRVTADDGTGPAPPLRMVLIPSGEFIMGSDIHRDDERPEHTVYVGAFYMDQYEMTWGQYQQYRELSRQDPSAGAGLGDDHPVTDVSWFDAKACCEWMGKRLPTEAEWEKAARGSGGQKYPWGDGEPDQGGIYRANYDASGDGYGNTAPVGSFPEGVSPFGVYDMAGNVWEWVADWYGEGYYSSSPGSNPTGPASGTRWVLRGGSWRCAPDVLRAARRHDSSPTTTGFNYYPTYTRYGLGFRCAQDE